MTKRVRVLILSLLLPLICSLSGPAAYACENLEECFADIPVVASAATCENKQALAQEIYKYGDKAVPGLVGYLEHPDERVRGIAGYILAGYNTIDAKYLPKLIEAHRAGNGWLPQAIAATGTDEAAKYLVTKFMKEQSYETQLPFAISKVGKKAIPYLLKQYECDGHCDDEHLVFVGRVLGEMGEAAGETVPFLTNIANDKSRDVIVRKEAIFALGQMGEISRNSTLSLIDLKSEAGDVGTAAKDALVLIGGDEATKILIDRIEHVEGAENIYEPFYILVERGQASISAGAAVTSKLYSNNRRVRLLAEWTLGFISYMGANSELASKLDSADSLEVLISAETLGRLKATSAIGKLENIRDNYWYPPVRVAAGKAVDVIKGDSSYEPFGTQESFYKSMPLFPWNFTYKENCHLKEYSTVKKDDNKYYENEDKPLLESMVYKTDDYVPVEIGNNRYTLEKREKSKDTTATIALKVDKGWLLGRDFGEFGGELVYWESNDKNEIIANENIQEIFRTPSGLYAIGGIAHMASNYGIIYKLTSNEGKWEAVEFRWLPKAVDDTHMLVDGRIFLKTYGAGTVLFTPETGKLEMAECAE